MQPYSFDLSRIFFGSLPPLFLLEIVFRTTILFVYLILNMRLIGQRSVGQLSSFEIALIIALGSAADDPGMYPDVPLIHGFVMITLLVLLTRGFSAITARSQRLNNLLEGRAHRIALDGYLDHDGVRHSTFSRDEVYMEMRQQGIVHLGMVKRAYLEPDGMVSVFRYPEDQIKPGLRITPKSDPNEMVTPAEGLVCDWCGYQKPSATSAPEHCPNCHRTVWVSPVKAEEVAL